MVNRLLTALEADFRQFECVRHVVPNFAARGIAARKMANKAKKTGEFPRSALSQGAKAGGLSARPSKDTGEPLPDSLPAEARSAVGQLMAELDQVKEELIAAQRRVVELEHRADEDALLPVLNRRGFNRELERTLAYISRHGTDICLIYIDLDDFKSVNDEHGHAAGDAALGHLTDILLANVRRSDVVARLGGDEFAILLHRADEQAAQHKADQLQRALSSSGLVFEGKEIAMSLTAGVTQLRAADTAEAALSRADKLMYAGKTSRKRQKAAQSV